MLKEIENILKKVGGRFIIVEDGRPRYVILDFEEFEKLVGSSANPSQDQEMKEADQEMKEADKTTDPETKDEVNLEDIPVE